MFKYNRENRWYRGKKEKIEIASIYVFWQLFIDSFNIPKLRY